MHVRGTSVQFQTSLSRVIKNKTTQKRDLYFQLMTKEENVRTKCVHEESLHLNQRVQYCEIKLNNCVQKMHVSLWGHITSVYLHVQLNRRMLLYVIMKMLHKLYWSQGHLTYLDLRTLKLIIEVFKGQRIDKRFCPREAGKKSRALLSIDLSCLQDVILVTVNWSG